MNNCAIKVPVSLGALALGLAGLAHLFARFSWGGIPCALAALLACGALAMVIVAIVRAPQALRAFLADSTHAAILSAGIYALIMLVALAAPRWHGLTFWIWAALAACSAAYLVWYTGHHALAMALGEVNPSILVPYCALGTVALAAEPYGMAELRSFLFLFVTVGYVILASTCAWRLRQCPLEAPLHPLAAICSAPLALAALIYLHLEVTNTALAAALVLSSQLIFLLVVATLPHIGTKERGEALSAIVFPLAVNAAAAIDGLAVVKRLGTDDGVVFTFMAYLEVAFALIVACAVLVSLIRHAASAPRMVAAPLVAAPERARAIVEV